MENRLGRKKGAAADLHFKEGKRVRGVFMQGWRCNSLSAGTVGDTQCDSGSQVEVCGNIATRFINMGLILC